MHRLIALLILTTHTLAMSLGCVPSAGTPDAAPTMLPQRVISTLPSITEVFFDIGLGDRIVGDSTFTKYPPEAASLDKIGGLEIDREKVISLKPDLIIFSVENKMLRQPLSAPVLTVDHRTLDGVLDSYLVIGKFFGEDILSNASKKQQELIEKLNGFEAKTKGIKPIRTLICIDRTVGTGRIQNLFVAGADSFLSEVVRRAGGENVAASIGLLAPSLSAEGIIELAPDVIIDIQVGRTDTAQNVADWEILGNSIPAVKHRRILTLTDDFATIPGPRTPMLIEKIVQYYESLGSIEPAHGIAGLVQPQLPVFRH